MAIINGTVNNDIIVGTAENDAINLLAGDDLGLGLDGDDLISGGEGIDILAGDRGNDILLGGAGNDVLFGGQNNDLLSGEAGNDRLIGNLGDDELNGNGGDDAVYGGQGNDIVRGGQGNDAIFGDIGNDVLYGDLGENSLTGGAGQDVFVIGVGVQTLIDFTNGLDKIGLANGLSFSNLTIAQGSGTRTIIRDKNGQILATIQGVNADQIDSSDFTSSNTPIPAPSPASTPISIPDISPSPSPTPTPAPNITTVKDSNLFGKTSVFLDGRRSQVRTQETNLGSLTADANLMVARKTDSAVVASLKNGGGIRDNIGQAIIPPGGTSTDLQLSPPSANPLANKQQGDISQLDIENALQFNNSLTIVPLTATQLKAIAEHGVAGTAPGETPGQFPQISGMAFSFDATKAVGSRVKSLAIKDDQGNTVDIVVENGNLVGDANRTIKVITLGFLATGGDGYPFPQGNQTNLAANRTGNATFATDDTEQDALAEYLKANYGTTPFNVAETPASGDTRIQNLANAADTVLNGTSVSIAGDGSNTITGDGNPNVLVGYAGVDNITGNGGNDIIAGSSGNDNLTGGADGDVFVFAAPGDGSDTITDFGNGADTIRVFASKFTGLTAGVTPTLTQSATPVGITAQFLYSGGVLSFDSDGTGATAAQTLATLTGSPALVANQIIVL